MLKSIIGLPHVKEICIMRTELTCILNAFDSISPFLQSFKTSGSQSFFNVFNGYRKRPLA